MMNLIAMIKRHEQFIATECLTDFTLFGFGHRPDEYPTLKELQRDLSLSPLSEEEAEQQLAADLMCLFERLHAKIPIEKFSYERQQAVIAIAYWLGRDVFNDAVYLTRALCNFDFEVAARCVLNHWPQWRAEVYAAQLFTGEYNATNY